jgi:nucleoid-associated protein YgaU
MGLFDEILGSALGSAAGAQGGERAKQSSSLVTGLLDLLDEPDTGGIQGLAQRSQGQGLGELVSSWIGTGQNRSITPDQVTNLLGAQRVEQVGQSAGLAGPLAAGAIAALLPMLIDKLTPKGNVPPPAEVQQRGREILRGEAPSAASASPGARPRADFSDVQAGSSTTAASPAKAAEPEIYVVVAGDSLSKIAKRSYGDANQWHRIFEANRDQIKNPDLIHPGQKLRIPRT